MRFDIPDNIIFIIRELENNGYEAYIVGGALRDMVLNKPVHDYDIATSATPEQVMDVFKTYQVIPTGIKHGTVTVVMESDFCEVTTFRSEGKYSDSRHPDDVTFETDILKDLSRRDFTFNAIAYRPYVGNSKDNYPYNHAFVDPYRGIDALENGVIEVVGSSPERFKEDPLRIMRLLRFYMQLQCNTIPVATYKAALDCMPLLKNVSPERIHDELNKILIVFDFDAYKQNEYYEKLFQEMIKVVLPEVVHCINFYQGNPYHCYDVMDHILCSVSKLNKHCSEPHVDLALALFLHDIGKPFTASIGSDGVVHFYGHASVSATLAEGVMMNLRYDNHTINKVKEIIRLHDATFQPSTKSINRFVNNLSYVTFKEIMMIRQCDIEAQNQNHPCYKERILKVNTLLTMYDEMKKRNCMFNLKSLAINGNDLIALGVPQGKRIGRMLNLCLEGVIEGRLLNDKEDLIDYLKPYIGGDVPSEH